MSDVCTERRLQRQCTPGWAGEGVNAVKPHDNVKGNRSATL